MSPKKKRAEKSGRLQYRIRRLQKKRRDEVDRLIALACEPVLPGTGERTFGHGPYCYVKGCVADPESMHVFRFRKLADAERAKDAAVTVDAIAEGHEDHLEEILASRFFFAD